MKQTPKEKAKELVDKIKKSKKMPYQYVKECALMSVKEILDVDCKSMNEEDFNEHIEFYTEVEKEILKLK